MIKIDDNKNLATQGAGQNKQTGASSVGGTENGADENFEQSDFATVMENLTKREKAASSKEREKTSEKEAAKPQTEKEDAKAKTESNGTAGWRAGNETVKTDAEMSLPPARSILHVADLERIVSSIRTNAFEGGQQIIISLKNSVLSGLQIKLTADDKGHIAAQFIAANEKTKMQIEARADELGDLLKRRGVQLSSLQTSLDTGTSGNGGGNQSAESFGVLDNSAASLAEESETVEIAPIETHSNIYRA